MIKKSLLSLIDQGLLSVFNLLIGIFLIKQLPPSEYGLYVLATSIILLVIGLQNALINTQMTVLAPQKEKNEQKKFCAYLSIGQFIYWFPVASLFWIILYISNQLNLINDNMYSVLLTVIFISSALLIKEFIRSYLFINLDIKMVFILDIFYILMNFLFILIFYYCHLGKMYLYVLVALGLSSVCVFFFPFYKLNKSVPFSIRKILNSLKYCLVHGKWSLIGVMVTWLHSQSYVYLITPLLGRDQMAIVHSARLLFAPIALLNMSYGKIFRAKWARDWNSPNRSKVFKSAQLVLNILLSTIIFYSFTIYLFEKEIVTLFFTKEYSSSGYYIVFWTGIFLFQACRTNASLLLQVFLHFKDLALANSLMAITTIIGSVIFIKLFTVSGSLLGMMTGEAFLAIYLMREVKKCKELTYQSA